MRLQDLGVELMVVVADYQTITDRDSPASLPGDVDALLADYLAVGIDENRATIFAHSQVEPLNQLLVPFLSLVSVAELSRNPTVKDEMAAAGLTSMSALLFTYPVHQAADILFCKATVVPVGKDQLPHLELTRSIARRFNRRYSPESAAFPEPAALLSDAPALLGTDGQKMSKSRGNAIPLSATADQTARLIAGAKTDAERQITYDPVRRPEVSNLVLLAALCLDCAPQDVADDVGDARQRRAQAPADRGRQRAIPRHPRSPSRSCRRPGPPPRRPAQRQHARAADCRTDAHRGQAAHAHRLRLRRRAVLTPSATVPMMSRTPKP